MSSFSSFNILHFHLVRNKYSLSASQAQLFKKINDLQDEIEALKEKLNKEEKEDEGYRPARFFRNVKLVFS